MQIATNRDNHNVCPILIQYALQVTTARAVYYLVHFGKHAYMLLALAHIHVWLHVTGIRDTK